MFMGFRRTVTAITFSALMGMSVGSAQAVELATEAREAILIDQTTGAILFQKDADKPMPPASMSKLMTTYLAFEAIADGRLKMDDKLMVSEKAWRMGGSKMFVPVGKGVKVSDLLRGIIVQSGNDACIVIAEALAGTEDAFAQQMTAKAKELGMNNSTFANATGWPHRNHRMSPRDLATLANHLITDFPDLYAIFAEREFTFSKIRQPNRNPILGRMDGADGLKTGHTEEAGYGLVGSAKQDDRRLIVVLNGMTSKKMRRMESIKVLTWGFREFDNYNLFKAGEVIEEAPVWLGKAKAVPLIIQEDVLLTMQKQARKKMKVTVKYDQPIPAPIAKGQVLAKLTIEAPGMDALSYDLIAAQGVEQLGFFGRMMANFNNLLWGTPE